MSRRVISRDTNQCQHVLLKIDGSVFVDASAKEAVDVALKKHVHHAQHQIVAHRIEFAIDRC